MGGGDWLLAVAVASLFVLAWQCIRWNEREDNVTIIQAISGLTKAVQELTPVLEAVQTDLHSIAESLKPEPEPPPDPITGIGVVEAPKS